MIRVGLDKIEISFIADTDSRTFAAKRLRDLISDLRHEFGGEVTDSIFTQDSNYAWLSRCELPDAQIDVFSSPKGVKPYFPCVGYCRISPAEKASDSYFDLLRDFEKYLLATDLEWHFRSVEVALDATTQAAESLCKHAMPQRFIDAWMYKTTIYMNRRSDRQIKLYQKDNRPFRCEITFHRRFIRQRKLEQLEAFTQPGLINDTACLRIPNWTAIQKRCGKQFINKIQPLHSAFIGLEIAKHCKIELKSVWKLYFSKQPITEIVANNNVSIRRLDRRKDSDLLEKAG